MTQLQNVDTLEFADIKENLKEFLKNKSEFTDYNFEGSALSTLLDVLAYNTHYNAVYTNLMLNESFIDSASKYSSVVSLAKSIGYTAKSVRAPRAQLKVNVSGLQGSPSTLTLPKGTKFKSISDSVEYFFTTLDDYVAPNQSDNFEFDIPVFEGRLASNRYLVTEETEYIIPNFNVDLQTIKVFVQESDSSSRLTQFTFVDDIVKVTPESNAFFIKQREDLYYEITFGNNDIGKSVENGNVVYIEYLISSGDVANNCTKFYYSGGFRSDALYSVQTLEASYGGAPAETVDSIRFNAPRNYVAQNRAVTATDYKTQIISNFPQIETLAVWGGQDNVPPVYGKVFISAKPFNRDALTYIEKKEIDKYLARNKSVLSIQHEFVDPEILKISITSNVYFNQTSTTKTEGQISSLVRNTIKSVGNGLGKFESAFRYSKLASMIDKSDPSIVSNITKIKLFKEVHPKIGSQSRYFINIGNPIFRGDSSVSSSKIFIPTIDSFIELRNDINGDLYIHTFNPDGSSTRTNRKVGTVNFSEGIIDVSALIISGLYEPIFKFSIIPSSNDVVPLRQNILVIPDDQVFVNVITDTISAGSDNSTYIFSESR